MITDYETNLSGMPALPMSKQMRALIKKAEEKLKKIKSIKTGKSPITIKKQINPIIPTAIGVGLVAVIFVMKKKKKKKK